MLLQGGQIGRRLAPFVEAALTASWIGAYGIGPISWAIGPKTAPP